MERQTKSWTASIRRWWWYIGLGAALAGCATAQARRYDDLRRELKRSSPSSKPAAEQDSRVLAGEQVLDRREFVRAVLERNPSVEAARQSWRAALARHPETSALEDPMLEYAFAPLSIGAQDARFGHMLSVRQRFPWPGKLALEGEVALAEAEAARDRYEATRLQLALMASMLFDRYYAVARSLELNEEHRQLLEEIQAIAHAQYEAGRASQQELLQAEIELSHIQRQRVVLESRRAVLTAQMNGLLHQNPETPLPPPPDRLEPALHDAGDSPSLQQEALRRRPELRAAHSALRSSERGVELAERSYYPDFGLGTSYNTIPMLEEHHWTVGVSLNIPIQLGARSGEVERAEAREAEARYQLSRVGDDIRVQVESARQRLVEAQRVVGLYREQLLPAARAQIEAAQSGYQTGRNSFQALIDAERSLRTLELEHQDAVATLGERRAELARAVGRIPGVATEVDSDE